MNISDFFKACVDAVLAPSSVHDSSSSVSGMESSRDNGASGSDWHNEWGTAADHQVPAERDSFASRDWSSSHDFHDHGSNW